MIALYGNSTFFRWLLPGMSCMVILQCDEWMRFPFEDNYWMAYGQLVPQEKKMQMKLFLWND